jgi:hypothetical protein
MIVVCRARKTVTVSRSGRLSCCENPCVGCRVTVSWCCAARRSVAGYCLERLSARNLINSWEENYSYRQSTWCSN